MSEIEIAAFVMFESLLISYHLDYYFKKNGGFGRLFIVVGSVLLTVLFLVKFV